MISSAAASLQPTRSLAGSIRSAAEPLPSPACLPADALVQALLIRYDPGAGIGWHRDRSVFDQIVGVSLGAPAVLAFRQRTATEFRRGNWRSRRAAPTISPVKPVATGNMESPHTTRCASRLPFAHLLTDDMVAPVGALGPCARTAFNF